MHTTPNGDVTCRLWALAQTSGPWCDVNRRGEPMHVTHAMGRPPADRTRAKARGSCLWPLSHPARGCARQTVPLRLLTFA